MAPSKPSYPREFYLRDTVTVARDLVGSILVRVTPVGTLIGRIVETEAYVAPDDEASHGYRGETPRNRVMFGLPGRAYVYVSYGVHHMLNIVTEPAGTASAVLIRALEPLEGVQIMMANRGMDPATAMAPRLLTGGPGRLCQAMNIDLSLNGSDLSSPPLYVGRRSDCEPRIVQTKRVGITRSTELPWRFYLFGSAAVSVRDRAAETKVVDLLQVE
jgi:DNA-3-methyladenine glycosylase